MSESTDARRDRERRQQRLRQRLLSTGLFLIFVALVVFFATNTDGFLSENNARNIARDVSLIGIVAVGMTMLVITGCIDLSVGSVLGVSGMVFGEMLVNRDASVWLAIVVAFVAGMLLGVVNGLVVTVLNVNPIITTLATWTAYRGIAFLISDGVPIYGFPRNADRLGSGELWSIPYSVWLMVAAFAIGWVVLNRTAAGRHIYAIGGNREAARLSGVRVNRMIVTLYAVVGLLAAVAGVLVASRLESSAPNAGNGFEISVITAVFVGGVSYQGGEGKLGGVVLGVLTLGVLQNGMTLMRVEPFVQQVVFGTFLLLAVALDQGLRKLADRVKFDVRAPTDRPPPLAIDPYSAADDARTEVASEQPS